MATMTVADLIEALGELDPSTPIHKYDNIGMPALELDYAGHTLQKLELMQSKRDPSFYARVDDPIWKDSKGQFGKPFTAAVIG